MQPQARPYIDALRREFRRLAEPAGADLLASCADLTLAQLLMQSEVLPALLERYRAAVIGAGLSEEKQQGAAAPAKQHQNLVEAVQQQILDEIANAPVDRPLDIVGPLLKDIAVADEALRSEFAQSTQRYLAAAAKSNDEEWSLSEPAIERWLSDFVPYRPGLRLETATPVQGVHAKEIYFLEMTADDGIRESLVMRRDRPVDVTGTTVSDEFGLMSGLFAAGLQVPEPICAESDTTRFGGTVLVMRRVNGREVRPADSGNDKALLPEIAAFLARLHQVPVAELGFPDSAIAKTPAELWRERIEHHYRWWQSVRQEPAAVVEWARLWMLQNIHVTADTAVAVHGDFSFRNLLIHNGRLSSVLDWELSHIGHPGEDLGYFRADAEATMIWEDFLAYYHAAGGRPVSAEQIQYFQIWGLFRNAAINANVQHLFSAGRTTDFFFGFAAITEYPQLLSKLTSALMAADRAE